MTEIHHAYLLRGDDGSEQTAEVIVLGPGADPLGTIARVPTAAAAAG